MTKNDQPTDDKEKTKNSSVKKDPTAANLNSKKERKKDEAASPPNWALRILLVLLIFISGVIASVYFMPTLKERLPFIAEWVGENDNVAYLTLNQRINDQQSEITALDQKTTSLETQLTSLSPTGNSQAIDQFEERIAQLEGLVNTSSAGNNDNVPAQDTSQAARIDMLLSRMSQLEASFVPLSKNMIDAAQAEKERQSLQNESETLSGKISLMENRLEAVERVAAKDNSGILINLKIAELKRQLVAGKPYEAELGHLQDLIEKSTLSANQKITDAINYLSQHAQTGIATPARLNSNFNTLIPALISTENIDENSGWWQTTLSRLKNLITVRRTETAASLQSDIDGMIAQIERWLSSEELAPILDMIETLPGALQTLLQDWKSDIEKWLDSQNAINELETTATEVFLANDPSPATELNETQL